MILIGLKLCHFCICLYAMKLDKFLGSKTKSDILKYLIFRRQECIYEAMSNDIARTFPAIKKQIDSLEQSEIIMIERE